MRRAINCCSPQRERATRTSARRSSRLKVRVPTLPGRKSGWNQNENATVGALANPTSFPGSGNRAGLLRDVAHGWTPSEPTAWRGCRTAADHTAVLDEHGRTLSFAAL